MTHRMALVLSIALTLLVSAGVFAGRDRLFAPEPATSAVTATTPAAQAPGSTLAGQLTSTSPRVVTVTLPPTSTTTSAPAQVRSERGEGSDDREDDDHDRDDDDRYEHDGEYDDD